MPSGKPLYTPSRERIVTSNAWAFLHWLNVARGVALPDWAALQRFSVASPAEFGAAIASFARLPEEPLSLVRHAGPQDALLVWPASGRRVAVTWDMAKLPHPDPPPQAGDGKGSALPPEIAGPLARLWPPGALIQPLAELLLHADLRPDDRLLVVGSPAWPWLAALLEGTTVILAAATSATLLAITAEARASVLVAPAPLLAESAFQRARQRPNLAALRTIVATGGALSPEGRTRIYTWVKPDILLLGRSGDTLWGNPLEPVTASPRPTPGFFTPPASDPAIP